MALHDTMDRPWQPAATCTQCRCYGRNVAPVCLCSLEQTQHAPTNALSPLTAVVPTKVLAHKPRRTQTTLLCDTGDGDRHAACNCTSRANRNSSVCEVQVTNYCFGAPTQLVSHVSVSAHQANTGDAMTDRKLSAPPRQDQEQHNKSWTKHTSKPPQKGHAQARMQ